MYVQAQIYDYNSTKLRGQTISIPNYHGSVCFIYFLYGWVGGVHNLEFRTTHTLFLERNYLNISVVKTITKFQNITHPPK